MPQLRRFYVSDLTACHGVDSSHNLFVLLRSLILEFECMLLVVSTRSLLCPSVPMHFLFFIFDYYFIPLGFYYSVVVVAEVSTVRCPLPSLVVPDDMSSDLDERS